MEHLFSVLLPFHAGLWLHYKSLLEKACDSKEFMVDLISFMILLLHLLSDISFKRLLLTRVSSL